MQDLKHGYHHGDVRRAALDAVAEEIAARGVSGVTMRGIASQVGVSHTAIGHAFGSRRGLLTALAVEGFQELGERLLPASADGFLAAGVAYVRFGIARPAHFTVMFEPELTEASAELREASGRTWAMLRSGVDTVADQAAIGDAASATIAAWSLMHGLVHLHRSGALHGSGVTALSGEDDPAAIAERIGRLLFSSGSA